MMNKIKILANIFSKITVCVLLASAIYITVMCGLDAQISVMILWQILLVSACSIPILMYPDEEGKEVSKQGMIARQIIYFIYANCAVLGLGRAFGWFYFSKAKMVVLMEVLIIGVYVTVNLIVCVNDHMVAESMNQKLKDEKAERKIVNYDRVA